MNKHLKSEISQFGSTPQEPIIKPLRTDHRSGGTSSFLVTAKDLEDADRYFERINRRNAVINRIIIDPLNNIIDKIRK